MYLFIFSVMLLSGTLLNTSFNSSDSSLLGGKVWTLLFFLSEGY